MFRSVIMHNHKYFFWACNVHDELIFYANTINNWDQTLELINIYIVAIYRVGLVWHSGSQIGARSPLREREAVSGGSCRDHLVETLGYLQLFRFFFLGMIF